MRMDYQNLYCENQAVTASAASVTPGSVGYLDHGIARDLGVGEPALHLVVLATVAFTDSGSDSTVTASLQTDSDPAFGTVVTTHTFTVFAALTAAGIRRTLKLGPDHLNNRYSRVYFTVANGSLTTGSFTAFITAELDKATAYAKNYIIS